MKFKKLWAVILAVALLSIAPAALAQPDDNFAGRPANYLVIKAGMYDPSNDFQIRGPGGTGIDINSETAFDGEVAIGHYFLPFLAFELGAGYLENKGTAAGQTGTAKLKVVPVVLSGRLIAPLGPVEPYIIGGVGAYLTDFNADVSTSTASGATKITYGLHAGAGVNFDITRWFFFGAEGRYLWSEPSFEGRDIKLDGFTATGDLGFRF